MKCEVCFHHCDLKEGQKGFCKKRICKDGKVVDGSYGYLCALALDPIEKKPLARFYPGSMILSAGTFGCNLACPFCQNHEISQHDLKAVSTYVAPEELVAKAIELKPYGNIGIAFTYNEPLISWEYVLDTFKLAKEKDLKTVLVTNGSINKEILDKVLPYTDALNIDLKGFDQNFYDWLKGDLETVKQFITESSKQAHVELTTLVIPGKNDDPKKMEKYAKFLAQLNPDMPLHLTRYFPNWKETTPPTPLKTMIEMETAAKKYLNDVMIGNVVPSELEAERKKLKEEAKV